VIFKPYFFDHIRATLFGNKLVSGQVEGYDRIINLAESLGIGDRELAYILATAYHETARTMRPIDEIGQGRGRPYGAPTGPFNKVYYGRGYVQLTWLTNYEKMDTKLQLKGELVRRPELAGDPEIAAKVLVLGMRDGDFTGVALRQFIDDRKTDFVNARKVVNALDRAAEIARIATHHANAIVHL